MATTKPTPHQVMLAEIAEAEANGTYRPHSPRNSNIALVVAAACGDPTDARQIEAMRRGLDASVEHHGFINIKKQ